MAKLGTFIRQVDEPKLVPAAPIQPMRQPAPVEPERELVPLRRKAPAQTGAQR